MSEHNKTFNNEVMPLWNQILETVKNIDVKGLETSSRDKIARLKKVVAYISSMIDSIDPDFVPLSILANIK
ncbi:TPA: hypothetical protein QB267_002104, partial [Pasteurella multocida]|nr:hypothetical protein [Pasteurella multocida]